MFTESTYYGYYIEDGTKKRIDITPHALNNFRDYGSQASELHFLLLGGNEIIVDSGDANTLSQLYGFSIPKSEEGIIIPQGHLFKRRTLNFRFEDGIMFLFEAYERKKNEPEDWGIEDNIVLGFDNIIPEAREL